MAKVSVQVRVDEKIKQESTELFASLGLDMSTAINIFLQQAVRCKGLPFDVKIPEQNGWNEGKSK